MGPNGPTGPLSSDAAADDIQVATVVAQWPLSQTVKGLLLEAEQAAMLATPPDPVSTSYLFAGMWRGHASHNVTIHRFISLLGNYTSIIEHVFGEHLSRFRDALGRKSATTETRLSANAASVIRHADALRKRVGSDQIMAARHLMAALVSYEGLAGTQFLLRFQKTGLSDSDLKAIALQALEETAPENELRAWRQIFKPMQSMSDPTAPDEPSSAEGPAIVESLILGLIDGNYDEREDSVNRIARLPRNLQLVTARRLRLLIQGDYAPDAGREISSSIRPPAEIDSARSWMLGALFRADSDGEESQQVLYSHLSATYEHDANARFWLLANYYQKNDPEQLSHALKAVAQDPSDDVRTLARAIENSDSEELLKEFSFALRVPDGRARWTVLRAMRIVPIPNLARSVVDILMQAPKGSPAAYDALQALTHPVMAQHAATIIPSTMAIGNFVDLVLETAGPARRNSSKNFATLLFALERQPVEAALMTAARQSTTSGSARRILQVLRERWGTDPTGPKSFYIAGYKSDSPEVTRDSLDIREDVQTLTAVMLAEDVKPPLAIGLYGDWGSGKSYFMQAMRKHTARLAGDGKGRFCKDVVSIEFNAWHYVDTSLWASLISHILTTLAEHVSTEQSPAEKQQALLRQLSTANDVVQAAKEEKERTAARIGKHETELNRLRHDRESKQVQLEELRLSDFRDLLKSDAAAQQLEQTLAKLGIPAAANSVTELRQVVGEAFTTAGRAKAMVASLTQGRNLVILSLLTGVVLLGPPLIKQLLGALGVPDLASQISAVMTQCIAALSGISALISNARVQVDQNLKAVRDAESTVSSLLVKKQEQRTKGPQEIQLESDLSRLRAKEQETIAELRVATDRVMELEEKIRSISESTSLARFLSDRTKSEEYRKHLGLVTTIRKDLESLSQTLSPQNSNRDPKLNPVERVVLYIDDLDRCPTDKVMEVLQAVHLLLAYPLFVVVVGVDPRWLLHSLSSTYNAFSSADDDERPSAENDNLRKLRTTPQNYLEKIFQIPFSLRPMGQEGYSRLVDDLFATASTSHVESSESKSNPKPEIEDKIPGDPIKPADASPDPKTGQPKQTIKPPEGVAPLVRPPIDSDPRTLEFVVHEEALVIQPWESTFAGEKLFGLIPTPRAVKRFTNIYRLLKAPLRPDELVAFEGTAEHPGEFQVPMLLLALLIGLPHECTKLFPLLVGPYPRQSLRQQVHNELISKVLESPSFPDSEAVYLKWVLRVSRFSFDLGRLNLPEQNVTS